MKSVVFAAFYYLSFASATVLFNGNWNSYATSTDLDKWSFSNPVGDWQCYIYGDATGNTCSTWVKLDPAYKNPIEAIGTKGARVELSGASTWHGDTSKVRTEMIPNLANSAYQTGTVYYKWSMKMDPTYPLKSTNEHQLVFFESHFCDLKYGGQGGATIQFWVSGSMVWSGPFTAGQWYNFAFAVNYVSKTVGFYQNVDGTQYTQVVAPTSASVIQDAFHLGALRLQQPTAYTDPTYLYYSGVYAEDTLSSTNFGAPSTGQTTTNTGADVSGSGSGSVSAGASTGKPCNVTACAGFCDKGTVPVTCNCDGAGAPVGVQCALSGAGVAAAQILVLVVATLGVLLF